MYDPLDMKDPDEIKGTDTADFDLSGDAIAKRMQDFKVELT